VAERTFGAEGEVDEGGEAENMLRKT